uniref:acetyl-CoA carboxylase beta subunit n=1 Tax=Dipteryx alata TaxID=54988 RepID=UPI0022049319|nr:acetyl-CoA carboxylase beta subunit [Dipteryx alata]UXL83228.1 acetyl-CoA carboxylase beta subunit [Dipteryx alata]
MKKCWFNSIFFNSELEYRCGLSKSMDSFGPIENTSVSEGPNITDMDKNIHCWGDSDNSSYSNVDYSVGFRNIRNLLSDETFLVRDSNRNSYSIDFDIENQFLEIGNDHSFLNDDPHYDHYMYDTKSNWNNNINSCIDSYLRSQIRIDSYILDDSDDIDDSYILDDSDNIDDSDLTRRESSNGLDETQKYKHLWIQCENCYELNYKKFFKSKMNICEHCGYHLKMSSSDRIELLIDPGTWNPMDEDMVSLDPIEFHSEEEPYKDRIDSYQRKTGLTEAVQTGTGQLNGIPVAIGIMDFQFIGGSMGSVVGEKITRLVEYATNQFLPLILVCASGGARMQEGSLSLMQMAKISSALYDYQTNKKLFYVSILTSPTTGGVTASFGMLGDIIIAEPNAYIAFAGKRVIEQTLNKTVPEGSQEAEYLFDKGLFDSIVPRSPLKGVLSELFQLHAFFTLTQN